MKIEDPTPAELYRCITVVAGAGALLPMDTLTSEERAQLGGACLPESPALVRLVARALRRTQELSPGLLADVPTDPAELLGRLARADAALRLCRLLEGLGRRAHAIYLQEQAAAAYEAMAVVEQVRQTGALPFSGEERGAVQRARALGRAEALLRGRQQARRRKARRAARRAAEAAAES